MAFTPYPYGYPAGFYPQPVPDQLAQLRQNQVQQPVVQQAIPMTAQPQPGEGGIIWVQGEAGAKAYLVAPGCTVQLWDSENQTIYVKSADMSGMPSMRVLDYTERGGAPAAKAPAVDLSQYITRDELENILADRLKRPARSQKQKEESSDE